MSILPGTDTPWTSFDIGGNCSLSGNYFAWLLTQNNEPPYPDVATFWRTAVEGHNSINATSAQIVDWHEWTRANRADLADQVIDKAICRSSMCQSIGSEIDGGLAGYGLLTSYGIDCILLTVYCAFAILNFLQRSKTSSSSAELLQALPSDANPGPFSRVNEAIRGTRYGLFMAAAFVSLGIEATVIYSQVTPIVYKYNSSLQLVVSALSFYPLAAMLPLILDSTRRGWMKGTILVGLFLIHTSAWVLCTNNAQCCCCSI
ncbi:hypothetical protein BDP81DRAFT_157745 [Colletotrichum phormii]|uniref:Uncharacterized protein n=1 Tax=Colletotrichum phormii TaxID=359342 RepID=A0AAJ0EI89_9PEZI|nr:uncharacterized protein BDP81DRAFT_157745 [Colletotrichum phormii]KAK1640058.1 hypothetical protein BDP81DRAFT_157745 [Colletotrichum phormii]